MLIGEVGVKDFGENENENEEIAKRFGVNKEDFPGWFISFNERLQTSRTF